MTLNHNYGYFSVVGGIAPNTKAGEVLISLADCYPQF